MLHRALRPLGSAFLLGLLPTSRSSWRLLPLRAEHLLLYLSLLVAPANVRAATFRVGGDELPPLRAVADSSIPIPSEVTAESSAPLLAVIKALNRAPVAGSPQVAAAAVETGAAEQAIPGPYKAPVRVWPEGTEREEPEHLLEQWRTRRGADAFSDSVAAALRAPDEGAALRAPGEGEAGERAGTEAKGAIPQAWKLLFGALHHVSASRWYAGRVDQLAKAFDPAQGFVTTWAGTVGGGLWKVVVVFPFAVWVPVSDTLPGSPAVGAFVVRPTNGSEILIGTGESYRQGGDGFYKSVDGGATWVRGRGVSPTPAATFRMTTSRADDAVVLAATDTGLFRSVDFGGSWTRVLASWSTDVV